MENNYILSALDAIPVADLTRAEWLSVGMSLQQEGYDVSVWDTWSQTDSRYHTGECQRLWRGFHGSATPVTGGTIMQMAKDRGWKPFEGDGCLDWGDAIEYDGDGDYAAPETWVPSEDLIKYLETLFDPDDYVGYVTGDVWQNEDGKWLPSKGIYSRTAGELIASLKKHPDDVAWTVGDWKKEVGAWIRFNPLDGEGVKNDNVAAFRYALVESDTLSIPEQDAAYRKLELPIAALVNSGNKSLHAIVRVDAADYQEYSQRVTYLYDFLAKNGVVVDRQNRNPSRLSRMPGVTRGEKQQYLVATNIGRRSWNDWLDFAEGASDELPQIESLADYDEVPELPEELIGGILRRGHKMLISGSSKAGKSFLLMELCVAIAMGRDWLGFPCKKGRVLYVDLEIDKRSMVNRFAKIYEALDIPWTKENRAGIETWPMRGFAVPLDQLVPKLIRRVRDQHFDAIIIDPIYKVIMGDENNASEMGAFCNQFDKICTETGCATIYCHHHSKGAQGAKRAMDRASGSGVFARDPDAQLDMIQLEMTDDIKNNVRDGHATAWRLESSLREFENIEPVNFWFEYPVHRVDTTGELARLGAEGSPEANLAKSPKRTTEEERRRRLDTAYDACCERGMANVVEMAEYMGLADRSMRRYLKEFDGSYECRNGQVVRIDKG